MDVFQQALLSFDQQLTSFKNQRTATHRQIKASYTELQSKHSKPFETSLERVRKDMAAFHKLALESTIAALDPLPLIRKHSHKIELTQERINKLETVIQNGCGAVVHRVGNTSRFRSFSNASSSIEQSPASLKQFPSEINSPIDPIFCKEKTFDNSNE